MCGCKCDHDLICSRKIFQTRTHSVSQFSVFMSSFMSLKTPFHPSIFHHSCDDHTHILFQSLLTSWRILGATRSCCTPGRAGTMHLVFLSGSTTRTLWSSVTKPPKAMVRTSPSARWPQMNTWWLKGCKIKGILFALFRICRHWSLLALLVWEWHLWARYRESLQNHRAPLSEPACVCEAETLQPIRPKIHQP